MATQDLGACFVTLTQDGQLRPRVDGVVLECNGLRSTFLPQVWEQLPDRAEFLARLKRKAGLAPNFWSDAVHLHRYTVSTWTEPEVSENEDGAPSNG